VSSKTEYKCDVCHKVIEEKETSTSYATAFGLRWTSSRGAGVLEMHTRWNECPIHVCVNCLRTISDVISGLRQLNKMAP
jgi:hypothetical protein